jgi:hypothetical protein
VRETNFIVKPPVIKDPNPVNDLRQGLVFSV